MKRLALFLTIVLAALGCGSGDAQIAAHLMHSVPNPNAAGDCYAINSFVPSVGAVAGDSGTPCTPVFLTTAYTNATTGYTAVLTLPPTQGAVTLSGECTLIWESSNTSGTPTFAIGASAAPTGLWVTAVPSDGVFVGPTYTTITATTTTAVTGALVTTTANTPYGVHLHFTLQNAAAANVLTVYASSNNTSYTTSVLAGSSCAWLP